MQPRVVLVGIEYEENLGMVARAMKNFGFKELVLVKPKAKKDSFLARQRAMHASGILGKAKTVPSLKEALRGTSIAIGTTCRLSKAKQKRVALSPEIAFERIPENAKAAIVLGRESSGLTSEEAGQCDFLVRIPASREYESLNVAVAAGILFYLLSAKEFSAKGFSRKGLSRKNLSRRGKAEPMQSGISPQTKEALLKSFCSLVDSEKGIQNPRFVKGSFRSMAGRAFLCEKEARAVLAVISRAERRAGRPRNKEAARPRTKFLSNSALK